MKHPINYAEMRIEGVKLTRASAEEEGLVLPK